LYA
jgi:hypothetical protein